jgi:hypothetical protein
VPQFAIRRSPAGIEGTAEAIDVVERWQNHLLVESAKRAADGR